MDGLINDCGRIIAEKKTAEGWFDLSTLKEPYRVEGKKTMGYEIAEQLNWRLPDVIVYPTGGGTGLIGMWKAFAELEELGWIGSARPRMVSVQASGCAPIVKAFCRKQNDGGALAKCPHRRLGFARASGGCRFLDATGDPREPRHGVERRATTKCSRKFPG